jgi:S1-C subfamily serine protease
VARNLVFDDTYIRKLPAKQLGVMVALIKSGAPVSLGSTPLRVGYIITKINDQPVINAASFQNQLHAAVQKAAGGDVVFVVIKPDGNTAVCRIGLQ